MWRDITATCKRGLVYVSLGSSSYPGIGMQEDAADVADALSE